MAQLQHQIHASDSIRGDALDNSHDIISRIDVEFLVHETHQMLNVLFGPRFCRSSDFSGHPKNIQFLMFWEMQSLEFVGAAGITTPVARNSGLLVVAHLPRLD